MRSVLEGIRVIDTTTGPVGGFATMVLADFGADVVKVEPPNGDRFRSLASSPLWLRGKRSLTLDLSSGDGRAQLHELVKTAEVLVTSGPPGRAATWGIDAPAAEALQPSIVHCSISGWGPAGPLADYPGYTDLVSARGGRMLAFEGQLARTGPAYAAVPVVQHAAAHGAVHGILAALIARSRTGQPQRVESSLLQALLPYDLVALLFVQLAARTGSAPVTIAATGTDMPTLNYHPILAADGRWLQCGNLLEHLFLSFLDAIDLLGGLLSDERIEGSPSQWTPAMIEIARDAILLRVREKTTEEWMAIFHANGNVAAEPYLSGVDSLNHADLVDNDSIVELNDPNVGRVRMIGSIASFSESPAKIDRPAPSVGEHNTSVLAEFPPRQPPTTTGPLAPKSEPGRPLAGITIVEFATIIAAPLSVTLLADLGARVIRVEVLEGDPYRHLVANGPMAAKTTAGKESICLDLKSAEGQAIARQLVAKADGLVHNFRPGVAERLGIGYEELHALHPQLVWMAVTGYGLRGPSVNRPATHPIAGSSMGGAGYQAGPALRTACESLADIREIARQLMKANEANPDPNTSVVAASSILLGLLARERHGIGQSIYVNMLVANAHANGDDFLDYVGKPPRPALDDELLGTGACHRLYRAGEGWVFLTITSDA